MNIIKIKELYFKYYESINFERLGLFTCIKKYFNGDNILYLGSSIHITPSFVFQNVTYIDNSKLANDFFTEPDNVKEFINSKKHYKSEPYIDFINIDYNTKNIKIKYKYDIGISLYSPKTFYLIKKFIRQNGVIIYLPLPSDNEKNRFPGLYEFKGYIYKEKEKYIVSNKVNKKNSNKYQFKNKYIDNSIYEVYLKK